MYPPIISYLPIQKGDHKDRPYEIASINISYHDRKTPATGISGTNADPSIIYWYCLRNSVIISGGFIFRWTG